MRTLRPPTNQTAGTGRARMGLLALVVGVATVQFGVAFVAAGQPSYALQVAGGAALLVAALAFPRVVLVLALLSTMSAQRVGPDVLDLSITDAVSVLGVVAALRFVPWGDQRIRLAMGGLAVYMGTLAVSLVANHPNRALFEWGHRGLLFGGALLIGVAIVRSGTTRTALRVFVAAATLLGMAAILEAVRTGFEPAYVFQLQKNHAGLLLAAGFVVVFAAGRQLRWPPQVIVALRIVTLLGLAATQSRAAALGLVAALAVRPLLLGRRGNQRAVSIGVLVVAVGLLVVSFVSLSVNDLSRPEDEQAFTSINTRTDVYEIAIRDVWLEQPVTGAGLRWFVAPGSPTIAPHNLVINELSEAGVIGLAGLVVLLGATVLALRRSASTLAVLGVMALTLRVTQGLAEIFWVAGPLTAAIILTGMGLADDPDEPQAAGGAVARGTTSSTLSR